MFSNITHLSVSRRISSRFCLLSSLRRSKSSMIYIQVQINPPNQTKFEKERERGGWGVRTRHGNEASH